ncbi:MAG: F0F1 ATP synthase subunit A [Planctomycetota bacterium]
MSWLTLPITLAAGGSEPSTNPADAISHVISHRFAELGPVHFTNHMMMSFVAVVVLLVSAFAYKRKLEQASAKGDIVTGRLAQTFEVLLMFVREEVARPNLGKLTDKYVPYLWTIFTFILFANVLGLIPTGPIAGYIAYQMGSENHYGWSYLGGTATGTLALTVPLAVSAFIAINWIGYREQGKHYFEHFNPGPSYMAPLLVPLEVMGLFIKCIVLAARLFGTMMAGHLVIAVFIILITAASSASLILGGIVGLGFTVIGFAIMALELFIAMLQAFIFTFLTTLFIAQGAVGHEEHDEHAAEDAINDPNDEVDYPPSYDRPADPLPT